MKMRTKATKTKCIEKDESAPAPKVLKVEPSPTTETDGGGGEGGGGGGGGSSSSSSNKICQMCGKVHNNDDIFKYLSVLPEDERYKCHYCSESFSYSCLFAAHIRACSNAYSSNPNNKKPNSTNNYPTTSVSTVTTAGNDVKNIVSPSVTTTNTSSNIYTKSDKIASTMDTNGYRCEVCSRIFTNRVVLTNHIERMHGGKGPTECEFCRKKYSSVVDLIMHKKSHVGMATYQCQYCDQHFMNRSMVTEHERIHTGDTPYRCEFCNRGFSYRSNLIVHKRIHDSKRNHFECDQCGQTFQHGAQLTRHKLVHTTDKPLDCRYCGKRFVIYNKLIAHIKEEHPNKS